MVGYQNKTALQVDRGVNSSNASSCETIEAWLLLLSAIDVPDVAAQLAYKGEFEAGRVLDYHDFVSGFRRCILLVLSVMIFLADMHQTDPENLTVPFSHTSCSTWVDTQVAAMRSKRHFRDTFGTTRTLQNETFPPSLPQ